MSRRTNSPFVGFVVAVAVILVTIGLVTVVFPIALGAAKLLLALLPILLMGAAIYSCIVLKKSANTKLLWIILIVIAPILGPLLWFLWGKNNT